MDIATVSDWINRNATFGAGEWGWLVAKPSVEGDKQAQLLSFVRKCNRTIPFPAQARTVIPSGLELAGFIIGLGANATCEEAVKAFIAQSAAEIQNLRSFIQQEQKLPSGPELLVVCVQGEAYAGAVDANNSVRGVKCTVNTPGEDVSVDDLVLLRLAFGDRFDFVTSAYDYLEQLKDCVADECAALYLPPSPSREEGVLFEMAKLQDAKFSQACSTLKTTVAHTKQSRKDRVQAAVASAEAQAVTFSLMRNRSLGKSTPKCPVLHYQKCDAKKQAMTVCVDALCYAAPSTPIRVALERLLTAAHSQILYRLQAFTSQCSTSIDCVAALHFEPFCHPHPITTVYGFQASQPMSEREKSLLPTRQDLHKALSLPGWPLIRINSALTFQPRSKAALLRDIHLRVPPSGVQGGKVALVKGHYDYHHYLQDKFDDKGWGCAYRTFQTIVSWLRLQGYTDKPVPDHRSIQETLVELEERPSSFVGSRDWIGANELGAMCDNVHDIMYKILFVPTGAEIPTKARELMAHFETHGSPVMIGGGQLAYGLLGVHFNENSGECKFLILDPHYIGPEDVGTIVNKKWCGWHGPELFLKQAFYNFCCPQRPKNRI